MRRKNPHSSRILAVPDSPAPLDAPLAPEPPKAQGVSRLRASIPILRLAGVFLLLAWLWRGLLLVGRAQGDLVWVDLRGALVDLWLALLLALGLSGRRILAGVAALVWIMVHYTVFQHVDVLGVLPNVKHTGFLGDATFFEGSVKGVRFLPLCVLTLLAGVAGAAWAARRAEGARRWELAGLALVLGVLLWLLPLQPGYARWRQTNALATLPSDLFVSEVLVEGPPSPATLAAVAAVFSGDLSGAPRFRAVGAKRGRNVLVLVLERLSAGYTTQGQRAQGLDYSLRMAGLEGLVDQHLFFPNFFSHQAQSNRGLYSLLAGDLPHLRTQTSKMTEVTSGTRLREAFLPAALKTRGYRSVFLEATPLHFMGMGQFMSQIGFDDAQDSSHIRNPRAVGGWGVDDGSLLSHTASVITDLEQKPGPWFVTVFSSGTHHPYTIPDPSFHEGEADYERSFHYLDQVLGEFLAGLKASGVLDDTLVLITCDESGGLPSTYEEPLERLDKNWGFLLAITPEGWKGSEPAAYGQADLALSVLDYLGLEQEATSFGGSGFSGRSVFRTYAEPRDFYLGNTYTRQLAVYSKEGTLAVFDEGLNLIASRAFDPQALLRLGESRPEPPGIRDQLLGVLKRSSTPPSAEVSYAFAGTQAELTASGWKVLVSGQWFETPPDSILELELDLVLHPEPGRATYLWTKLRDNSGVRTLHETASGPFSAGGRRRLRYRFHSSEARHRVEVQLGLDQGRGKTKIEFKQATLRVRPRSPAAPEPDGSVQVLLDEVIPAPGPFVLPIRGRDLEHSKLRWGGTGLARVAVQPQTLLLESRELPFAKGRQLVLRGKVQSQQVAGSLRLELVGEGAQPPQTVRLAAGRPFEAKVRTSGGKVRARVVYEGPAQTLVFQEFELELRGP